METVFWMALPVTFYGLLALTVTRPDGKPGLRDRLRRWWRRLWRRPEEPAAGADGGPGLDADDPLAVLALQVRLGVLADHIRALEADDRVWARARRLEAAQAAYDALLDEACRLAGIPSHLPPGGPGLRRCSEGDRFEDELALAQRGWSW
jgi:hypothetical protein